MKKKQLRKRIELAQGEEEAGYEIVYRHGRYWSFPKLGAKRNRRAGR